MEILSQNHFIHSKFIGLCVRGSCVFVKELGLIDLSVNEDKCFVND